MKRGFIRKLLSPVVGYGTDYELLHFVYDLSMWTTVGTKKNIARRHDVPLRLVLKGCPWTPQYWRVRHLAVVDMQRQCGNAALFRTRAPYEKSFPYHEWVLHEQRLAGRPRQHLAGRKPSIKPTSSWRSTKPSSAAGAPSAAAPTGLGRISTCLDLSARRAKMGKCHQRS